MSGNGVDVQTTQIFDTLPNEMLLMIFSHSTSVSDRFVFSLVSKRFRDLAQVKFWRKNLVVKFTDLTGQYSNRLCTPVPNSNNLLVQEAMKSTHLECLEIQTRNCLFYNGPVGDKVLEFYGNLRYFISKFFKLCKKLKSVKCTITGNRNRVLATISPFELFLRSPSECASLLLVCPLLFKNIEIPSIENCNELAHILTVSKKTVERLRVRNFELTDNILSVLEQCEKLRISFTYPHVTILYDGYHVMNEASFLYMHNKEESFGKMILRNNSLLSNFFSLSVKQITIQYSDFNLIFDKMLDHCTNLETLNVVNVSILYDREFEFKCFLDKALDRMSYQNNLTEFRLQFDNSDNSKMDMAKQYIVNNYTGRFKFSFGWRTINFEFNEKTLTSE